VWPAWKRGTRRPQGRIGRVIVDTIIDTLIGSVSVVGDAFDAPILRRHMGRVRA